MGLGWFGVWVKVLVVGLRLRLYLGWDCGLGSRLIKIGVGFRIEIEIGVGIEIEIGVGVGIEIGGWRRMAWIFWCGTLRYVLKASWFLGVDSTGLTYVTSCMSVVRE